MKLDRSKDWWMTRARQEGDTMIGAGSRPFPATDEPPARSVSASEESRIAFGKFVNLMRRRNGYSIERLAEIADLEASVLLVIEECGQYEPTPRTVYKLAQTFAVPQQRLMQLAGLAVANDSTLTREAVRFAARSEPTQKLTREEKAALEEFVAVLGRQDLNLR